MAVTWWSQLITTIVFIIGAVYGFYFARVLAQKLPEQQVPRLVQFADMAVQSIEQQFAKNPDKKGLALGRVFDLYREYCQHPPSQKIIEMAIEAAVLRLPKSNE